MKVLFMANIPSPYRVDFFNELGKYCDLTVTFEGRTATDRDEKWKAAESKNFKAQFMKGIRTKSDQFLCFDIIKVIKSGFDRIIVGGYSTPTAMLAIEYMRLHKMPFWIEADGGLISQDSALKYRVKRHFISAASGWFSSGKATGDYLVHYGAKKENIYQYPFSSLRESDILSNLVSSERKKQIRDELKMEEEKIVISVGQFIQRKGFDILLKAWKGCSEVAGLYIIGAEVTEEYTRLQKELKLKNVHFVGFKSQNELKKYYQAADMFVLTTREDIWGLVINEAMANGLPVVTTERCVAGLELVKNGVNGYIVPVENVEETSNAINDILQNSKMQVAMAKSNLSTIRNYTIEQMAIKHMEVFETENHEKNRC